MRYQGRRCGFHNGREQVVNGTKRSWLYRQMEESKIANSCDEEIPLVKDCEYTD